MRFSTTMEGLGTNLVQSVMTLIAFLPILLQYSYTITEMPFIGEVPHALVFASILWAAFGTGFLAIVGVKLPGLEFKNQRVEAAYRKELVYGEDDAARAQPPTVRELFSNVRRNYFRLYFHYTYFNIARIVYLQTDNIFPYIILAPSIVAGKITLGLDAAGAERLRAGALVLPVPRQFVDDDRRAALRLQTSAHLRNGHSGRASAAAGTRGRPPRRGITAGARRGHIKGRQGLVPACGAGRRPSRRTPGPMPPPE